jgi:serine/threonine protein kinase/tetratricopeptide (TPR) repeat protein
MAAASSAGDDPIEALLGRAVQELEQGGEPALERFLAGHPTEARAVHAGLERLRRLGILAPPPPAPLERVQFGEFRVLQRLGVGGMGIVYKAEQTSLQRTVALKVVRPEFLMSQNARDRFRREVDAIARLNHPGIVPILAVGNEDTQPWFAMELVEGHTFEAMIAAMQGRDPARADGNALRTAFGAADRSAEASAVFANSYWETCVRLVLQVATTMSYVHERGVVHRDLKPSNIIVTPRGQARVLDFGLAHVRDLQRVTREAQPMGSPAYSAPEQLRGEAVDERVDVYGLGVTLYELLATRLPFESSSLEVLQQRILAGGARGVRAMNAAVPRDLEVVCAVAMDRDRSHRYGSMADFAADLDALLQRRPIRARPLGWSLRLLRIAQRHPTWAVATFASLFFALQFPLVLWRQQAEANEALAGANDQLATKNRELARREQEAADNLQVTLDAIGEILGRTSREYAVTKPRGEDIQLDLAERATRLFESLRQRRPGDRDVESRAAAALGVWATMLADHGDEERAERLLLEVRDRLAPFADDATLAVRAASLGHLGAVQQKRGKLAAAEQSLREALCELERGLARAPDFVPWLRSRAAYMGHLATVLARRGEHERGLDLLQQRQQVLDAAVALVPFEPLAVYDSAANRVQLAELLQTHRRAAALNHCDRAIAQMLGVLATGPSVAIYADLLASAFEIRGGMFTHTRRFDEAVADHGRALALRCGLLHEFPERPGARFSIGTSWNNLAIVTSLQGDYANAANLIEDAVTNLRDAATLEPADPRLAPALASALTWRIEFTGVLRQDERKTASILELASVTTDPAMLLAAARMACVHAATRDDGSGEQWREHALTWIERAITGGFADGDHFEEGPMAPFYDDIRTRPRFTAALAKLQPPGR